MICKIFISIFTIMLTISFGQVGKVSFNKGRLVPKMLNYQGYLTDTLGSPVTDNLDMTFKIFDAVSSGNKLWSETQTNIPIERGVFSVLLGETTPIPDSVFGDFTNTWLELTLEGPQILTPRTRITSVGYAYTSTYSDTAEYARVGADNDWQRGTPDSVLFTSNFLGIARGGAGNTLYGDSAHTHTNLGVNSRTGASGLHHYYCTIGGGISNIVSMRNATIGGGRYNVASGDAATIAGGNSNAASQQSATIGGGQLNTSSGTYATVSGGVYNTASSWFATVGGGGWNTASTDGATIAGGYENFVEGEYSAICGGYADTITATADYSYLFGIASELTEDSTFMVDMPHIRFGDETNGYEFPVADGSANQVMVTDGSGQMSWGNGSSFGSWSVTDSVLYTNNYWGIARGGANNMLHGDSTHTHTNFGSACTTGISGQNNIYITVSGGYNNTASRPYTTVGGGQNNTASEYYATVSGGFDNSASAYDATVSGGIGNTASGSYATVCGGWVNTASNIHATVSGGEDNTASRPHATVAGGYADTAAADYSYATNYSTYVPSGHTNSAAFTTSHTIAANQVRAANFSTGTMMFTMDHPSDPMNKILNQHAVGSSEAILVYNGTAYIDKNGRVEVVLPDYFEKINRNPMIQLTGVGSSDVVFVAEDVRGNSFVIGGKSGMKVYWTVTGERTDIHAEIARIQTPVEQQKTGDLIGHSHDDDALIGIYDRLQKEKSGYFAFKTEEGRRVHEQLKRLVEK